jgi:hypothetical protein
MTSFESMALYGIGAMIGVFVLYYAFEKVSGGSTNSLTGKKNYGKAAMNIIASIMVVIILYVVYTTIYGGYEGTLKKEPWLVETTKTANRMSIFPAKNIPRSSGGQYGIEFTYSLWLYISEWVNQSRNKTGLHHILHKGSVTGIPDQCPGIWLDNNTNDLIIKMNTFYKDPDCDSSNADEKCYLETCRISNIPIHKWVHITISVINTSVDIYVNGYLKKRCLLKGLPRQNDGDVYINAFGGFDGLLSRVRYFAQALPLWKIESILKQGPSDAPCEDAKNVPPYLASDYWETTRYSEASA